MSEKSQTSNSASSESKENKDVEMEVADAVPTTGNTIPPTIDCAIIHPLVLLSVVDHYTRVAKDTKKRVIGVLLGEENRKIQTRAQNTTKTLATLSSSSSSSSSSKSSSSKPKDKSSATTSTTPIASPVSNTIQIDITNSYALPFEEDPSDKNALFIDKNYHEEMFAMFKKINANEKILGWYSTGTTLQATDLLIHEIFRQYCPQPVLVLIDVNSYVHPAASSSSGVVSAAQSKTELPTKAYISIENSPAEYSTSRRQFQFIPSQVGAFEAEEVGVEHLLRNIKDTNDSNLTDEIQTKLSALRGFRNRLVEISSYLDDVLSDKLPINQTIIANLQDMFNLTPNITSPSIVKAFAVQTNDELMVVYVSSLIRSIIALHDLINNKIAIRKWEKEKESLDEEKEGEIVEESKNDKTAVAQA